MMYDFRNRWLVPLLWEAIGWRLPPSPSVACSADGGSRIVTCHHTVQIYGRKETFLASETQWRVRAPERVFKNS